MADYGQFNGSIRQAQVVRKADYVKASPLIRLLCGILGFAGAGAIAFNVFKRGSVEPDFTFFASLLGTYFFVYVAFYGESPTSEPGAPVADSGPMTAGQWRVFWAAFVVSIASMTYFLLKKGVFDSGSPVVLLIVGVAFALIGIAIYLFVKGRTDDFW